MSVAVHKWPEADNATLCRLLDAERRGPSKYPGAGVWVGPKTLFAHVATSPLQAFIHSCLPRRSWQLQGWGVVLEAGARLERHDHKFPGNVWSGVYYPQGGGGAIEFDRGSYEPEESCVLIFPADAPHSVVATAQRYSIAFNARAA